MDKLHKWGGKPYLAYKFFFDLIMRQMVESVNWQTACTESSLQFTRFVLQAEGFTLLFIHFLRALNHIVFDSSETRS